MIGVSKTFGGSSILSSPVSLSVGSLDFTGFPAFFHFMGFSNDVTYDVNLGMIPSF